MRALPLALALATAVAVPATAQDFRWTGRLAQGRTVEIRGVNGDVDVTLASGAEVEVTAVKRARDDDPATVKVEAIEHAGGVTICAVYPDRRGRNRCAPGEGYRMNTEDNDVQVHFTVRLPAGVKLDAETVNGGIEATGLRSDVEAETVNGGIEVSTTGLARGETVNGGVKVALGRADWTGSWQFETVNGSIEVTLPADASLRVEAETVNGDISTDFPLTVQGRFGPRSVTGTIGGGGRDLELSTVNGSIRLRKAS
jgi:DUF4097 and DUF4098 domain-containing protein YvlB